MICLFFCLKRIDKIEILIVVISIESLLHLCILSCENIRLEQKTSTTKLKPKKHKNDYLERNKKKQFLYKCMLDWSWLSVEFYEILSRAISLGFVNISKQSSSMNWFSFRSYGCQWVCYLSNLICNSWVCFTFFQIFWLLLFCAFYFHVFENLIGLINRKRRKKSHFQMRVINKNQY